MSVPTVVSDIIRAVEKVAPPYLKLADDPTGFQVGDEKAPVERVLFCLEVTGEVVEEAAKLRAELIIAHHPLVFRPLARLITAENPSALLIDLVKRDIAVYAAHTSLDRAVWGVSDALAEALGVKVNGVLAPAVDLKSFKLVVFVPPESIEAVSEAVSEAGAGEIGEYSQCSFRSTGIGTFRPGLDTAPYAGRIGELNEVPEVRLEVIVRPNRLGAVIDATRGAHPYEEMAYDVYQVETSPPGVGFGRLGVLEEEASLADCTKLWQSVLGVQLRVAGDPCMRVKRVALCGGSGGELVAAAASSGADVFVTGDIKHHAALEARAIGMAVVDAGHHATEATVIPGFADRVGRELKADGIELELLLSCVRTDPWSQSS